MHKSVKYLFSSMLSAFVFSLGQESFQIEEAYASVIRGLPWNLGLKAGKYRLGFGRLNPAHPHAYPFISTPRVIRFPPGYFS